MTEKDLYNLEPGDMFRVAFRSRDNQVREEWRKYKGAWMRVTGKSKDYDNDTYYTAEYFRDSDGGRRIQPRDRDNRLHWRPNQDFKVARTKGHNLIVDKKVRTMTLPDV